MQDDSGNQPPAECPEGLDYRQLRAYLRSSEGEDQVPLPPGVEAHIYECVVCGPKWKFLLRTDPIVKRQFESRALRVAEQVTIQEIIFQPEGQTAQKSPAWTGQVQKAMAAAASAGVDPWFERPVMDRIQDTKRPLEPKFVVDIFDRVRSIPDKGERSLKGRTMAALFDQRLRERRISQDQIQAVFYKWASSPHKELLTNEMTVEAAALIPETAEPTDPPLLTMVGEHAMFDAPQLQRLRRMAVGI